MQEAAKQKEVRFSDYLSILYKWKKFLIINLVLILIISLVYSLLISKTYKASSKIMLPSGDGFGGLSSLLSQAGDVASLGAKLFGIGGGTSEDLILGIFYSRSTLERVINEFDLYDYYGYDTDEFDKTLKAFKSDISFEPNEFGLIEINVINEDPTTAADIANFIVGVGDSVYKNLKTTQARNNRLFIEKRFFQNITDLTSAENDFSEFQKKEGVFAVPEQIELAAKAGAELEAQLVEKQIILYSLKNEVSENSAMYLNILNQIEAIKKKISELKVDTNNSDGTKLLIPFKEVPDLQMEYLRKFRALEAQNRIMEFLYPLYEQAKIEEQKSIPTLLTVDKAIPPQLKHEPKRAYIVLAFTSLGGFILIILIFFGEFTINRNQSRNVVEKKEKVFFDKIVKLYNLKF